MIHLLFVLGREKRGEIMGQKLLRCFAKNLEDTLLKNLKKSMEILDISWPISEAMTAYKDRRTAHFFETGGSISDYKLATLCGPCTVFDLTAVEEKIGERDLKSLDIKENEI